MNYKNLALIALCTSQTICLAKIAADAKVIEDYRRRLVVLGEFAGLMIQKTDASVLSDQEIQEYAVNITFEQITGHKVQPRRTDG